MKLHLPLALLAVFLTPIAASAAVSPSDATISISPAEVQDYLDALAGGNLTISGKNTVHFHDHTKTSGNGGIFYEKANTAATELNLTQNTAVLFTNNSATGGNGGVISSFRTIQTNICNNTLVSFVGNSAKNTGGVYHTNQAGSMLTVSGNTQVEFLNNSATSTSASGGAIYAANALFENNELTIFSGNSSAKIGGVMTIGGKGSVQFVSAEGRSDTVRFSNNYAGTYGAVFNLASGNSSTKTNLLFSGISALEFDSNRAEMATTGSGGVFYANSYSAVELRNNTSVSFTGNCAGSGGVFQGSATSTAFLAAGNTSLIFTDNHAQSTAGRGGVFANGNNTTIEITGNKRVEFSHNSATEAGGVACGGILSFTDNEELLFHFNTTAKQGDGKTGESAAIAGGGAIYYDNNVKDGNLTISGNKVVEFRGNAEGSEETGWLLRSIYACPRTPNASSPNTIRLCATNATDRITFYDTVYVSESLKTELNKGGSGRITFSGKYTEADLAALGGNGDVTASRTSIFKNDITIEGGVLEIADGAILQTNLLTTASGATTELNSGHLTGNLTINGGGILSTTGCNTISGTLSFASGSAVNLTLGAENLNTAAVSTDMIFNSGNAALSINTEDLIDGKYLVLTTNTKTGTQFTLPAGLSWEGNNLYLTVSGNDNTWHVRSDFTYGSAVDESASQSISLDGGTLKLTKDLDSKIELDSSADSTISLAAGVTLQKEQLAGLSHGVTLTGDGTYQLGNSADMKATLSCSTWKGEVHVGDADRDYTTISGLDLAKLGTQDSTIRLQGVQGSLAAGSTSVESDLILEAGDETAAIVIDNAAEGDSTHFSGNISSASPVNFIDNATSEHSYEFSGDVSSWSGQIVNNSGTLNITYSGEADTISTDIRAAKPDEGSSVINLHVDNNRRVVFNGEVKDSPTWSTKTGRQLNIEINNDGNETIFRKGVEADSIRLSKKSTLVAQTANSSTRISISAANDNTASITAVDIKDSSLSLKHTDCTETRGKIHNAAIVLGDEVAVIAMLGNALAVADAATATYNVSDIDFTDTTLTARSGTFANLSAISLDAGSALVGDGSGNHLLQGNSNTIQLSAGDFILDSETGIYTYTTTQVTGFTLGAGAALTIDASLLHLPETSPGSYTFNIILQDFTTTDGTPSINIVNADWESPASDYTWLASDRDTVATFTANTVPEPATAALSLIALLSLTLRRRRH